MMARTTMTRPSSAKKTAYGNRRVSARRTPFATSTKEAGLSEMLVMVSRTTVLKAAATTGDLLLYHAVASESSSRASRRTTTRRLNRLRKPLGPPIPTVRCFPETLDAPPVSSAALGRARQRLEGALEYPEWSPRFLRPVGVAPARSACGSRRCLSRCDCTPEGRN